MTKLEAKQFKRRKERADNKIDILGVGVSSTSLSSVLANLKSQISNPNKTRPFMVVTVNPEFVMQAQKDEEFRKILNGADLAIADGVGLRLAGIKNIVPGRQLVSRLINSNYRVFYLGGRGGVAEEMVRKYGGQYDDGHLDVRSQILDLRENARIIKKINDYKPDILLVTYGAPWQEKWLNANRQLLNAKVMMGVGGAFDYLVGRAKLPPVWVEKIGLEWLWRLIYEPWRWRRQLNLVRFCGKLIFS